MLPAILSNHVKLQTDQRQVLDKKQLVCSMEVVNLLLDNSCSKFKVFQKNKIDFNIYCDPLEVQQVETTLSNRGIPFVRVAFQVPLFVTKMPFSWNPREISSCLESEFDVTVSDLVMFPAKLHVDRREHCGAGVVTFNFLNVASKNAFCDRLKATGAKGIFFELSPFLGDLGRIRFDSKHESLGTTEDHNDLTFPEVFADVDGGRKKIAKQQSGSKELHLEKVPPSGKLADDVATTPPPTPADVKKQIVNLTSKFTAMFKGKNDLPDPKLLAIAAVNAKVSAMDNKRARGPTTTVERRGRPSQKRSKTVLPPRADITPQEEMQVIT